MESRWNQGIIYIDQEKGAICVGDPSDILFSETCEQVNDWITRYKLTYKNTGEKAEIIPVFETVTEGEPDFYMIPCCAYQGNEWGTCREPKGMERDGKPWIFSSDRVAVPGCSIVEMQESCHALFADHTAPSSDASSTVYVREGNTIQRIYFSHVEYPVTYVRKFDYDPPVIRYLTLDRGEEMSFTCYTYSCPKSNPGELYGYVSLFDFINTEYLEMLEETVSAERVKELNFDFIESVTECKEGKYISNIGFLPDGVHRNGDPNSTFLFRKGGNYEIGWCGQNISVAEMYIRRYLEKGCQTDLEIGTGIMDTWLERRYENGLMSTTMNAPMGDSERMDTCNLGWFVWKATVACELLKKAGKDPAKYEQAVRAMCDFFLKDYPEGGFPQMVNSRGEVALKEGGAGAMLLVGFLHAYRYFGEKDYLARAVSAFDFYYDVYLKNSIAAGGALDTYCVDKESAGPVLRAALLLHEITEDKAYLDKAEKIAHYLMTWCFYHDVEFPAESDSGRMGLRTTGGTSVSTAHHHLDCWGAYYVPDMIRLYRLTGNRAYANHARILWRFTVQYISDGELVLHGMKRMAGAQNEAIFQNLWCTEADGIMRGTLNDWLIIWVKTFQLDALYAVDEMGAREML